VPDRSLPIEQILSRLAAGPPRLAALTTGLDPARLRAAPGPGEWSANEVLAHLRSCADVWGGCIATIMAADAPTNRPINPTTWINSTEYLELEFQPSLQAFAAQRTGLLASLQALAPAAWTRSATVTGAGKALERSIHSYAQWLARHERPHIKQIERIANALRSQPQA
jgi:hypothetical protein